MIPYFKKYVIISCVLAVAVLVIVSTAYAAITGSIMASTPAGLICLLVLMFGTLFVSQSFFARKADAQTEEMLSMYNDDCDPQGFTEQAAPIAANMREPYDVMASWFLTYFAQARLDEGDAEQARAIEQAMLSSADDAKSKAIALGVLMNTVPLATKMEGPEAALKLVDRALALAPEAQKGSQDSGALTFLNNQKTLLTAAIERDYPTLRSLYAKVHDDDALPMRIRVESAWKEAQACHSMGDAARERECLEFVIDNGNMLALVAPARKQLAALT